MNVSKKCTVCNADGKFAYATAHIDGSTVPEGSPAVHDPVLVRYGWASSPQCNLFNGAGSPASMFTSLQ